MNRFVQNKDNFLESVMRCVKEENVAESTLLRVNSRLKSMKIKRKSLVITQIQQFDEATMQALEEERDSRRQY